MKLVPFLEEFNQEILQVTNLTRGNTDHIWVDDYKGLEKISKEARGNGFVDISLYWYSKSYFSEIRQVWQKPVTRKFVLERI